MMPPGIRSGLACRVSGDCLRKIVTARLTARHAPAGPAGFGWHRRPQAAARCSIHWQPRFRRAGSVLQRRCKNPGGSFPVDGSFVSPKTICQSLVRGNYILFLSARATSWKANSLPGHPVRAYNGRGPPWPNRSEIFFRALGIQSCQRFPLSWDRGFVGPETQESPSKSSRRQFIGQLFVMADSTRELAHLTNECVFQTPFDF